MDRGDKIYANTPSGGSPLGFNSLFERLENLRQLHYTSANQLNTSALATPINTEVAIRGNKAQATNVSTLNDALKVLKESSWEVSNTDGTTTTLKENFSSEFAVPSVGSLITANSFNQISNQIVELESICPVYSGRYSGFYSTDYNRRYSTDYSSFYGSRYSTDYSTQYSADYSSQYSSQYSSFYGGRYGSNYVINYTTRERQESYSRRYS